MVTLRHRWVPFAMLLAVWACGRTAVGGLERFDFVNRGVTVVEAGEATISPDVLSVQYGVATPSEIEFAIVVAPTRGELFSGQHRLSVGDVFTQADIDAGSVRYVHLGEESLGDFAEFSISAEEEVLIVAERLVVTVIAVNDPPQLVTNAGLVVPAGGPVVVSSMELAAVDADSPAWDVRFVVTAIPVLGALHLRGNALVAGDEFSMADIQASSVAYVADQALSANDEFQFSLRNGGQPLQGMDRFALSLLDPCESVGITPGETDPTFAGAGTIEDPHGICTAEQFHALGSAAHYDDLSKYYVLVADIDMNSIPGNHNRIGDNGTGDATSHFTGGFFGNGFSIRNWRFIDPSMDRVGVFGWVVGDGDGDGVSDGTIDDVAVIDVHIEAGSLVGGLVAFLEGTITRSSTTGYVSAASRVVGGLVGRNCGAILASHSRAEVVGATTSIGGLCGDNHSMMRDSFATGNVTATGDASTFVGGIAGHIANWCGIGNVERSYATGNVTATGANAEEIGGLVGRTWVGTILDSFATGTVRGGRVVGGVLGQGRGGWAFSIYRTYATGNVYGSSHVGGLIGQGGGGAFDSFATGNVEGTGDMVGGVTGILYSTCRLGNTYATGAVTGNNWVGGLVGYSWPEAPDFLKNSYATGPVTAISNPGGLVGGSSATANIVDSFWDSESTGMTASAGGSALTTSDMLDSAPFVAANWPWVGSAGTAGVWVMRENDTATNDTPQITTNFRNADFSAFFYFCHGEAWTSSPRYLGSGSWVDPYLICTAEQLRTFSSRPDDWGGITIVGEDIDLAAFAANETGRIGTVDTPFTGTFDGNARKGYSIKNFSYSADPAAENIGFFGVVGTGAQIRNVALVDAQVQGGRLSTGILVGLNSGWVSASTVTGLVSGERSVGGLVGNNEGEILRCAADAQATGTGMNIGGGVGVNDGHIFSSYSVGTVTASGAGGRNVGGLIGANTRNARVANVFSLADVQGADNVGGLIGIHEGALLNAYYAGSKVLGVNPGGLIGADPNGAGSALNAYWNVDSTQLGADGGTSGSRGGTGRTDVAFRQGATFGAWDFDVVWTIDDSVSYPELIWAQ